MVEAIQLQLLLAAFAGWVTRPQAQVIMFADRFKAILRSSGTKIARTSIPAPNMNAFAKRFAGSIKSECLDREIFVSGDSLDHAIREFMIHYRAERPHQGPENALIGSGPMLSEGRVEMRDRLGGLLKVLLPKGRVMSLRFLAPYAKEVTSECPILERVDKEAPR